MLSHVDHPIQHTDIQVPLEEAIVRFGPGAEVQDVQFPAMETLMAGKSRGNTPMARVHIHTLCCSWFNASVIAYLHYKSHRWANSAAKRFEKKFRGRRVQTKLIPPPAHHGSTKSIWSVQLGNIPADTEEQQLLEVLRSLRPEKIVFGKNTSHATQEEAIVSVKRLLSQQGRILEAFETVQTSNGAKTRAFVKFKTPSDAKEAIGLSGTQVPKLGSKLYAEKVVRVKIPVLEDIYAVLGLKIQELQKQKPNGTQILVHHGKPHKPLSIHLFGPSPQAVAKVKADVEKLLRGAVVLYDDGNTLWDDYFANPAGILYIRSLSQPGKLFLYRDLRRRQLRLYGSDNLVQQVRQGLITYLRDRRDCLHCIPLEGELWHKAREGGFRRVMSRYGKEKAKLDITQTPKLLLIQGSPEDAEAARQMIAAGAEDDSDVRQNDKSKDCPACLSMAENPIPLCCGHCYCQDCFEAQCHAASGGQTPVICYGDDAKCRKAVPMQELQQVLAHEQYEALLSWSLEHHVRSNPNTLAYCPTPDCPTIFRPTDESGAVPCQHCLMSICPKCCTASHEGAPCNAAQEETSVDGVKTLQYMEANNVQACPNCRTRISKTLGCHNVVCKCGKSLCWLCMAAFDVHEECYDHLNKVHGRISDEFAYLDD